MSRAKITTRTYTDEDRAEQAMIRWNRRNQAGRSDLAVIVEGPESSATKAWNYHQNPPSEWTVMMLSEAIANDFTYRWAV